MSEKDKLFKIIRYLLTFWLALLIFAFVLSFFTVVFN